MKIVVQGLWHLGCVTAACCAKHFQVMGLDFDPATVTHLRTGRAPLMEPGLDALTAAGLASGRLNFTCEPREACADADVLWATYDTPVDENDECNVEAVFEPLRRALPHLRDGALVLVSSQLPVGSCHRIESEFPRLHVASSPENLRLGRAIDAFEKAERVIVGIRRDSDRPLLEELFAPFSGQLLFMRTESAEMVKHGINSFLALSIAYINEIARLCEHVGADAKEVAHGLKSEPRIGPRAYLNPGGPFAGGTLARDVVTLSRLGTELGESVSILSSIKQSNDRHRGWALGRLRSRLGDLQGRTIALLGLVYKPGTDTLRRSTAMELASALLAAGARVQAYDPALRSLPRDSIPITLAASVTGAASGADAIVVSTEWPEFRSVDWTRTTDAMRQRIVIDANRFLEEQLVPVGDVEFISVGRA